MMKTYRIMAFIIALMCVFTVSAFGENTVWGCSECGKKDNTGKFCGNCGHQAPWLDAEYDKNSANQKGLTNSGSSFNLSGLSFEELCSLKEQVNQALWSSDGWQEVQVPPGLYRVGTDIPAGKWRVSISKEMARIKIGSELNASGNEVSAGTRDYFTAQISTEVPSQEITFIDGMYVGISYAELIFTPATGANLNFK